MRRIQQRFTTWRETLIVLILYVDDCLMDADKAQIEWLSDKLSTRFECKDIEWLTEDSSLDYLGVDVTLTPKYIAMSMPK